MTRLTIKKFVGLFTVVTLCLLQLACSTTNRTAINGPQQADSEWHNFPAELGEVIYSRRGEPGRHIFIIGQNHRSSVSGLSNTGTLSCQSEIYRIGEWLIANHQLGLLLPEGFFADNEGLTRTEKGSWDTPAKRLDEQKLQALLSETSRFVNADQLLSSHYGLCLGQVENVDLYQKIRTLLFQYRDRADRRTLRDIHSLQHARTYLLLDNIPEVVEEAYLAGLTPNHSAMFTIGLAHIEDIMELLQDKNGPKPELFDQGYGITIIIPKSQTSNRLISQRL